MTLIHDVLSTAPLFSSFVESDLVALASAMRERTLKDGDVLFRQGQSGDAMVLVTGGQLSILAEEDGQSVELAQMAIGDIVGEMSALDPAPRSATVKALGDASICVLDRTMLGALFTNAPTVYSSLLTGIGQAVMSRLARTNKHYREEAFDQVAAPQAPVNVPNESQGRPVQGHVDASGLKPLSGFSAKEREVLLTSASVVRFDAGEVLCAEGRPGHTCFIIGGGEVEVLRHSGREEYRLTTLGAGTVVGQLALLHDTPRSATVRALETTWVVAIHRGVFDRLLQARDTLALKLQEQAIVAGIRQLRIASRVLAELRAEEEQEEAAAAPPPAPTSPAPSAREQEARLLDELKRPDDSPWGTPSGEARTPPPSRPRPSPPPSRPRPSPPPGRSRPGASAAAERARRSRQAWSAVDGGRPTTPPRPKRSGGRTKTQSQHMAMYVSTALSEWGLSLSDLDDIQVSVPAGQITAAELKARKN